MFSIRLRGEFSSIDRPIGGRKRSLRAFVVPALAFCAALSSFAPARAADTLPAADRRAIERVIRQQLDAFGRDDATGAFAVATPEVQRMFGNADRFLALVRDEYDAVYRPASVRFVRLERIDGEWTQTVLITDEQGKVWGALYTMRRQVDRGWKVGGCRLVETDALAT
jgi:Domain of unknown function (DUF4864)